VMEVIRRVHPLTFITSITPSPCLRVSVLILSSDPSRFRSFAFSIIGAY
jgi:hypothetical protein